MKGFVLATVLGMLCSAQPVRADVFAPDAGVNRGELRRQRRDSDRLGWYVPDFAKLQTAGFLGSVGAGFGYAIFDDIVNVSALYGFTPESRAGHNVHTAKLSVDVRPFDVRLRAFRLVPVYLGGSLMYAFGGEYFTRLPNRYTRVDRHYYPPTALHWMAQLGLELDYVPASGRIERHGLYYELVTVDTYVYSLVENSGSVDLTDTLASTLGYRCAF